ncbi:hypothetical protein BD410DRAFT_1206 [Rickenella mellea]|uniref:DUF6697 domain-containing protein n=1 Tax=Rickenella mellea TaxID=50990 RepID=A0A4R5XFW1_9AGAM|nr:hypothetical protein BD410DRAFT_1206 [Rickenella mellea]
MAPVSTARSVLPPTKSMLASRDRKTVGEDLRNARVANIREQKIAVDADHCTKRAFSRAFISHLFGGSPQETFSRPRQDLIDRHGYDGFMCLNTSYNPNAPGERGAAGLFFSLGAPRETPRKHEKVFLRTGANLWMYLGDYEMVRTEPLSSFEYRSLNQNVTNTWTSKAMDKGWALHIRASIRLRRNLRREPTTEELKAFVDKAGQNSNLAAVEIHEIKDAFRTGKEVCYRIVTFHAARN